MFFRSLAVVQMHVMRVMKVLVVVMVMVEVGMARVVESVLVCVLVIMVMDIMVMLIADITFFRLRAIRRASGPIRVSLNKFSSVDSRN